MSISSQNTYKNGSLFYSILLILFPFSILFSVPIDFRLFYARIDEIFMILCIPMVLIDLKYVFNQRNKSIINKIIYPYVILSFVFSWGIAWGNGFENLTVSYLRNQVFRPIYLILVILMINSLLRRANIKQHLVIGSIITAICFAGLLGYYAMNNPDLSMNLVRSYNPDLEFREYFETTFDMSVRAMSVFTGYDQASVTYGFGCILAIALILCINKNIYWIMFSIGSIAVMFVSIISSARVGLVSVLGGGLVLILLPNKKSRNSIMILIIIVISFIMLWPQIEYLFPNYETIERIHDLISIFNIDSMTPFVERSEGLSAIIETQVIILTYPTGLGIIFGFGDNTGFVSDVAYVTYFIKYGLVGLFAILFIFYNWVTSGIMTVNFGQINAIPLKDRIALFALTGMVFYFSIAATKGSLYFLTSKTGDLVSIILGIALFEAQSILDSGSASE